MVFIFLAFWTQAVGLSGGKGSSCSTVDRVLEPYLNVKQYEANERTINDIYFSTFAKGDYTLSPLQITTLRSIAEQCPFSGGPAVFNARSMHNTVQDTIYDDRDLCTEQGILWRIQKPKAEKIEKELTFKFYPNPASDYGTLQMQGKHNAMTLEIVDILGRSVYTNTIADNAVSVVLPFDKTASGIYMLIVRDVNGYPNFQQKIIIAKQ
jgi:hypothetical protein